jgi:hypothetical protein
LVVQNNNALGFYKIMEVVSLPAPVLSLKSASVTFLKLEWTDQSIYETGFTLQYRVAGNPDWMPLGTMARNTALYTKSDLSPNTIYEFRIRAEAENVSSGWSAILSARTLTTGTYTMSLEYPSGGVGVAQTVGQDYPAQSGYAVLETQTGDVPYATAVMTVRKNGVVVSEVGVPSVLPQNSARIFIDYRTSVPVTWSSAKAGTVDINTGIALVNRNSTDASITYKLIDQSGTIVAVGHGILRAQAHQSFFIDQLFRYADDFELPADFAKTTGYATLDIASDQPVSILALRMAINQRDEILFTTTPVSDPTKAASAAPLYFPQFVDGGGYRTALYLMNTTQSVESGTVEFRDNDGSLLVVGLAGNSNPSSTFQYNIPSGGFQIFISEGAPLTGSSGWIKVIPDPGMIAPEGGGVFSYAPGPSGILISESGIPSTIPTTHARIFVELGPYIGSDYYHNYGYLKTGLALAIPGSAPAHISLKALRAFSYDYGPSLDTKIVDLNANGHLAQFVDQIIPAIWAWENTQSQIRAVLEISSDTPFIALTMRTLKNTQNDFLFTLFPVADLTQPAPAPIVFPQIADGDGYQTEFILLNTGSEGGATLSFYDDTGAAIPLGQRPLDWGCGPASDRIRNPRGNYQPECYP